MLSSLKFRPVVVTKEWLNPCHYAIGGLVDHLIGVDCVVTKIP